MEKLLLMLKSINIDSEWIEHLHTQGKRADPDVYSNYSNNRRKLGMLIEGYNLAVEQPIALVIDRVIIPNPPNTINGEIATFKIVDSDKPVEKDAYIWLKSMV